MAHSMFLCSPIGGLGRIHTSFDESQTPVAYPSCVYMESLEGVIRRLVDCLWL